MAYVDQKAGGGRIVAIVIVALIHALLGYALVTGLAQKFVKQTAQDLDVFDVEPPPPPPPPDEPPPPPPDQPNLPPPPTTVVTPPPIVPVPVPAPAINTSQIIPQFQPTTPPAPPTPPQPPRPPSPPPPPRVSQAAVAKGSPISWYTTDDYPAAALREGAQGKTTIRVDIDTGGRVAGCNVTSSSGNSALDDATCRVARRRGRYTPAKDQSGNPIAAASSYTVTWRVPDE